MDLVKWYTKGYNDELNGSSTIESDIKIENDAYQLGANDALKLNINFKVLSAAEILKLLKYNNEIDNNI